MAKEHELLGELYAVLRRMETCPAHEVPRSHTGVVMHEHYDSSRVVETAVREKNCTMNDIEDRETEYVRVMGRVKKLLENAPS